jgi:hypothetical protein
MTLALLSLKLAIAALTVSVGVALAIDYHEVARRVSETVGDTLTRKFSRTAEREPWMVSRPAIRLLGLGLADIGLLLGDQGVRVALGSGVAAVGFGVFFGFAVIWFGGFYIGYVKNFRTAGPLVRPLGCVWMLILFGLLLGAGLVGNLH